MAEVMASWEENNSMQAKLSSNNISRGKDQTLSNQQNVNKVEIDTTSWKFPFNNDQATAFCLDTTSQQHHWWCYKKIWMNIYLFTNIYACVSEDDFIMDYKIWNTIYRI